MMNSSHFTTCEKGNNDVLKICLTVLVVSVFVSAMVLPLAASARVEKPRVKVKGNALPMLKDPGVEKMLKPQAGKKLFLVMSLNTYEPARESRSTVFFPSSPKSKQQLKFGLVVSFLKGSGLKILNSLPDLSAIWVEGTVSQVEKAFQVSIDQYRLGTKEFFASNDDPSVPSDVADAVVAVAGLENYQAYHPLIVKGSSPQARAAPLAEIVGPPYDPYEIRSAYNLTNLYASGTPTKLTGKGINVAIISAYGNPTIANDWAKFCTGTHNGGPGPWQGGALPRNPQISTFYPSGTPADESPEWALETALDVEWVHAIAPGAKINLIVSYDASFAKVLAAFQWTVTNKKGAAISMSFGAREADLPSAYLKAWSTASRNAAKKGITMLASAGNYGYDEGNIIHPASDPYTVAVGGTELWTTGAYPGVWSSESAWTDGSGGMSILFPKQAWQYGTNVPLDGVRDTPDVSAVADPNTGVYVYCGSYYSPGWYEIGGTSLGSPIWAALVAIVDQAVGAKGSSGGIGLADPWLYRVFRSGDYVNCFHDITTGAQYGGYSAGVAYDLVTGIGTPDGWYLLTLGAEYLRVPQTIANIPYAKAIAVNAAGTMYIGTFQWTPTYPHVGVLYELEKGSTAPRAVYNAGGITDIAVDKNGKVYFMTYTTLYRYDPSTGMVSPLVNGLLWGWGVYVDKDLNVYYTDLGVDDGSLYWIPYGGASQLLQSGYRTAGIYVDISLNIYTVEDVGNVWLMNASHTTWTKWKDLTSVADVMPDIYLDNRLTAYLSNFDSVYLADDYPLLLAGAEYDENIWLDSKTGIYYVDWSAGWIRYLPPEKPT